MRADTKLVYVRVPHERWKLLQCLHSLTGRSMSATLARHTDWLSIEGEVERLTAERDEDYGLEPDAPSRESGAGFRRGSSDAGHAGTE
jgi:hypothetical protein